MNKSDKTETKQKITLLKIFNKRLNTIKKEDIEKQLQSHEASVAFKNVTMRKRKLSPLTSEDRLKELPSIHSKTPVNSHKKLNYLVI